MGYIGQKWSENAERAYENGEKPISKWTKDEILDAYPDKYREQLSKIPLKELRENFLKNSSWHHTGKYFNKTKFYQPYEEDDELDIDSVIHNINENSRLRKSELDKEKEFNRLSDAEKKALIDNYNQRRLDAVNRSLPRVIADKKQENDELYPKSKYPKTNAFFNSVLDKINPEEKKEFTNSMFGYFVNKDRYGHLIKENENDNDLLSAPSYYVKHGGVKSYEIPHGFSYSNNNIYLRGRKPNQEQHNNPQSFFTKGEQRYNYKEGLQEWDGNNWNIIEPK